MRCHTKRLCNNYESLVVPEHGSFQTGDTCKNQWINFHKISQSSECLHWLTMHENLLEKRSQVGVSTNRPPNGWALVVLLSIDSNQQQKQAQGEEEV